MPDWDSFLSSDNFGLAWQRILRSKHYHNKDRIALRVYEANLETNLKHLIDKVREDVFEPGASEKIYVPKRSGTVRSLPVLCMEDRLVYQALVNIVARKSKTKFEAIVGNYVFAHLLSDVNDEFMLKRWDGPNGQYRKFLKRFEELWQRGNRWLIQADIASYYDSIDHGLLCKDLLGRWIDSEQFVKLLRNCLYVWASHQEGHNFSQGLPQGYEASDYLATLFLLQTDEHMIRRRNYLRYVDDVRILAPDRDKALHDLHEHDVALKKQALILQPTKTGAREIKNINEEFDDLAATLSMLDQQRRRGEEIDDEAEEIFFRSWNTLEQDEHAEAHLIFALNRIRPSDRAKKVAIKMLHEMPWRSDSVNSYLRLFKGDDEVISALRCEISNHKAYAWHLANCVQALAAITDIEIYRNICCEWIENKSYRWYQRLAAVESLQHDFESYSFLLLNFGEEPNSLVRNALLVATSFAASNDAQRATAIRAGLKDKDPQIRSTAVWLFLEFPGCGIDLSEFGSHLGVCRSMISEFSGVTTTTACYIEKSLVERFDVTIPSGLDFRSVFAPDYEQAISHIRRALRYHDTDPVIFVTSIDNFNQVIAIKISEVLANKHIPKDQYGNILSTLKNQYGIISIHFHECHELRSRSQGPHAWATSLGTWSKDITHQEKNKLMKNLRAAYQQFVDAFAAHQGINIT